MNEPILAAKTPAKLDLAAGEYRWCRCGRSKGQPFCDGTHQGTGLEPLQFALDQPKRVALCQCKQTQTPPFCDGTHAGL